MSFMNYTFRLDLTDFDEYGNFTNSAMLKYLQEAGALHSASVNMGPNDISKTGFTWILINWKLQILSRPMWNSNIYVKTWCSKVEKIHTFRDFEVYDENNNIIAKASSKWVLFNIKENKIEKNLEPYIDLYKLEPFSVFDDFEQKLKEPESYDFKKDFSVLRRDIDSNHHVNNVSYLKFAYEVLPEDLVTAFDFNNIEIMYKSSTLSGENYSVLLKKESNDFFIVSIKSTDLKTLHAIIYLRR